MRVFTFAAGLSAVLTLAACDTATTVSRAESGNFFTTDQTAPAHAAVGTCWDKSEKPGTYKTVTEDVLVQPAQVSSTGTVESYPIYRTVTRRSVVTAPEENWVQIVCAADLTTEYVASVQRALALRGYFRGDPTGTIDAATRGALRRYQLQEHIPTINPGNLTVEAARSFGLWTASAS